MSEASMAHRRRTADPAATAFAPRETAAAALPDTAKLDIITTPEGVSDLGPQWRALEARCDAARYVFQSHDWCDAWCAAYLDEGAAARPHILVGRMSGETVLIWPLMISRLAGGAIASWLSAPVGQFGDVLVDPRCDRYAWLDAACAALFDDPGIDGLSLRHVRADAAVLPVLKQRCRTTGRMSGSPYLDLTVFRDAEDYTSQLSRNQRSQRAKLRKKLERDGALTFEVFCDGAGRDRAIDMAIDMKRRWLAEQGLNGAVVQDPSLAPFLKSIDGSDSATTVVSAGVLSQNGAALSIDIGLHHGGEYFGFLIVQDPAKPQLSASKVHLDALQKWCIENGMRRFDMMVPADPYKMHWANGTMPVHDFAVAASVRGIVYCELYLNRLRPGIKRAFQATPAGVRKPAMAVLNGLRRTRA